MQCILIVSHELLRSPSAIHWPAILEPVSRQGRDDEGVVADTEDIEEDKENDIERKCYEEA